jgi:hypothetical protein|tara:strand:- start:52 stop:312 length:261 start_codon:yes stop_codon:yes gene_type:complete
MDNVFIKAATSLLLHDAMEELKQMAIQNGNQHDEEYLDNMLLISMIGYAIATGRDKRYIVEMFANIVNEQQDENEIDIINQAKDLL